jgi:hypothetical protein
VCTGRQWIPLPGQGVLYFEREVGSQLLTAAGLAGRSKKAVVRSAVDTEVLTEEVGIGSVDLAQAGSLLHLHSRLLVVVGDHRMIAGEAVRRSCMRVGRRSAEVGVTWRLRGGTRNRGVL